ncbi:MAG: acyloxyacyl hydrolase [Mesorhizobium sp.]
MIRQKIVALASLASLLIAAAATPSHAASLSTDILPARFGELGRYSDKMEARLGVMAYDRGFFSTDDFSGTVINGELLFRSPEFLEAIGSPRPYIGFDAAIAHDPVHFFYAGLNWDMSLTDRLYLSASLGGSINTARNLIDPTTYKALGCRVLFHLGAGIGFDITPNLTIQAYADHFSDANLCRENNGAEATGVRVGYRF